MKNTRRTLLAALATLAFSLPVAAQVAGTDYVAINPPQATDNPAKIEVLEFFSYACPHCNDFNPQVHAWAAKQPADVVFKKVPVTFGRAAWVPLARLYYALETTGDLAKMDAEVFKAVHVERVPLFEDKAVLEWVAKKGLDAKKFGDAYNSFSVVSKVKRGDQVAAGHRIQAVPSLAVEGKYLVTGKNFGETLATADKLIAKSRSEKTGKK